MARIFLSYASERHAIADEINLALVSRRHEVFFDRDDLPEGQTFENQIEKGLQRADLMVFLISPESVKDGRFTRTELKYARTKWPSPNGRVLPVLIAPTPLSEIPAYLKAVTILEPSGSAPAEVAAAVDQMVSALGGRTRPALIGAGAVAAAAAIAAGVYLYGPFRDAPSPDVPDTGAGQPVESLASLDCVPALFTPVAEGRLTMAEARTLGENCAASQILMAPGASPNSIRNSEFIDDFVRAATSTDPRERLAVAEITRGETRESSDTFLALARSASDDQRRARYYRAAATVSYKDDPARAISALEQVVLIEPDDLDAWSGLAGLYTLRGDTANAERAGRAFADRASRAGPDWQASALLGEAYRQIQSGQSEAGLASILEARRLFEQTGNRWGVAQSLVNEAEYRLIIGQFDQAGILSDDALTLADTYQFPDIIAQASVTRGRAYVALMQPDMARPLFVEAEETFTRLNNPGGALFARSQLGLLELQSGNFSQARDIFAEVRSANARNGFRDAEAWALVSLGQAAFGLGDLAGSEEAFTDAARIFSDIGSPVGEANALSYLSNTYTYRGRPKEAMVKLEEAFSLAQDAGNGLLEAQILTATAFIRRSEGDNDGARADYEQALARHEAASNLAGSLMVLEQLGHVSKAAGDRQAARNYWSQALVISKGLNAAAESSRLEYELSRL